MDATTDEGIFARMTGFHELRLSVAPDHQLGCVSVDVTGMGHDAVLAPSRARVGAPSTRRCCALAAPRAWRCRAVQQPY
jgi:hypothetical protein